MNKMLFDPFVSGKKKNFSVVLNPDLEICNYGIPTLQKDGITYSSDV